MANISPILQKLVAKYELEDKQSLVSTEISGLHFSHTAQATPRTPIVYDPGIVIIFQGSKTAYLADKVYHYDANQYLLLTVPMALECETIASKDEPLIGLFIDVDLKILNELVHVLATEQTILFAQEAVVSNSICARTYDNTLKDIIYRLLNSLQSTIFISSDYSSNARRIVAIDR